MSKKLIAFGDVHFPQHDQQALEVLRKVVRDTKPDIVVCLGDLLDCKAFATHPPDGEPDTPYDEELRMANELFDHIQKYSGRLVMVEGNHEHRIARFAARDRGGKAAWSMLSPKVNLSKGRSKFTYVPYSNEHGQYAHYKITPTLAAVHGWSYALNATRQHLNMSQGMSIIHGHTHRSDHVRVQQVFARGTIDAVSAGCLCQLIPTYCVGNPMTWTHGFVQGFLGTQSHTLYVVPVEGGGCVLPSGKETKV